MLAFAEGTSASAVPVITKVWWVSCGNHATLDHSDAAAICSANPLSRGPLAHLSPNSRSMSWDHWRASHRGPHPNGVDHMSASIAFHQLAGLLGAPPRPHDVEARTSPRTLSGMSWANCWATIPPKDRPSTSARSMRELIEQVAEQRREVVHRQYGLAGQDSPSSGRANPDAVEPVEMPIQRCPRGQRHPQAVQQQNRRPRAAAAYAKLAPLNPDKSFRLHCHVELGAQPSVSNWSGSTFDSDPQNR